MLNRTQAPPFNPIVNIPSINGEKIKLTDELEVHILRGSQLPVLRLEIVFPAGKWYEQHQGVAHFASKMLLEGTRTHSANEIAEMISFYGASLTTQSNGDWGVMSLYCLSKHFTPLVHLIKDILSESTFPESEYQQLVSRTAQSIRVERKKNSYLASEALTKRLYGPAHPYISTLDPDFLESVPLDEVKSFFENQYNTKAGIYFLSGAVEDSHLQVLKELAGLHTGQRRQAQHAVNSQPGEENISSENKLQSAIKMGKLVPAPPSPDYLNLVVLNEVLGGYFGSRLMKNIREDKGFTYGIHSQLVSRAHTTSWVIGTEVNSDNAEKALLEIKVEFARLRSDPLHTDELETIKNSLLGKFLSERATIFDQTEWYKFRVLHNLPESYFDDYLQIVRNASPEHIQQLANKFLSENDWVTVTVGK